MTEKYFILFVLLSIPFMQGCPDVEHKVTETHSVNDWVYDQMEQRYLWAAELPEKVNSGLETPTREYFDGGLRYRSNTAVALERDYYGDRFSSIKYTGKQGDPAGTRAATERDYDFGFLLSRIVNPDNSLDHIQVLYVVPGGPADMAGLRRGDTFDRINDQRLTNGNYLSLLANTTITVRVLNRETGGPITIRKEFFYNYPILLDTIYDVTPRTAYLIYNHFTDGDTAAGYAGRLKETFARYKAEGVENLILDLRYNGGGELENARLLASLIVPADMLGKEFMRTESNSSMGDWNRFQPHRLFTSSALGGGNADIRNLYVITSQNTASASELIIHTLRPVFRDAGRTLFTTGQTTRGKNVGGITVVSSEYEWEISPITLRVYNLDRESGYETGLVPDTRRQDSEYLDGADVYWELPPLGDFEKEYLLNIAVRQFLPDVPAVNGGRSGSRSAGRPTPVPMVPERGLDVGTIVD